MVYQKDGKKAFITEGRGLSPLAKKEKKEEKMRPYFQTLDGSLVFDIKQLQEVNEAYRGYLTR